MIDFNTPPYRIYENYTDFSWNDILEFSFSRKSSFILTSHLKDDPRSEFSFAAINPYLKFSIYSEKIIFQFDGKPQNEIKTNQPFSFLNKLFIKQSSFSDSPLTYGGIFLSIGYEFAKFIETEKVKITKPVSENQLLLYGIIPKHIFRRNEKNGKIDLICSEPFSTDIINSKLQESQPIIDHFILETDFKKYQEKINQIKNYISEGDTYEMNFSYQIAGEFNTSNDFQIWKALVKSSPSSFFSCMKNGDFSLISSSPERFLKIEYNRLIVQPMKGTRKSTGNSETDLLEYSDLKNSEKDKAENVMIVDLMRNDIGKISKTGSVKVTELFKIEKYKTVFQMISTVESELKENITFSEVLKATFPPGSMTGAPKIRTMEIIAEMEDQPREFYSGITGYYDFNGNAEFSVLIRCLEKTGKKFKAKFGGAIVSDSNAEMEFDETKIKMAGILKAFEKK